MRYPTRQFFAARKMTAVTKPRQEIYGKVNRPDGTVVDLGRISSPWPDNAPLNWAWKKLYKEPQIRRLIQRSN